MANLPARPRYISQSPPRSGLFIPLISGEETIGIVAAQSHEPNCFQEEDMRRLMILSNQAAAAIANARLYDQERMRAAHLELVGKIAREVNAVQDRAEIFDQVVSTAFPYRRFCFEGHPLKRAPNAAGLHAPCLHQAPGEAEWWGAPESHRAMWV